MTMKFHWGTGILITIILFILAVVAFYIWSLNLDINLVEDNYYEKELAYQDKIDRIENTKSLPGTISLNLSNEILTISFPDSLKMKNAEGHILFYRPSDPGKDFSVPLQVNDSSIQVIDARRLDKGRYVIKIDWMMDGKGYYFEEAVYNK
jgi:hypothetical protein